MPDYSAMETLYRKGILEYNPKDYINGTSSNIIPETEQDTFLPDNRFARVDGSYIRNELDKDIFEKIDKNKNNFETQKDKEDKNTAGSTLKNILTSKVTAGIIGTAALILSGRYILKLLHIIK